MSAYTWTWAAWIAAFAVIETMALRSKQPGDTLSEHVWRWFAITRKDAPLRQLRRAVLLMGMAWLTAHFMTGGAV